jgi:hypothetical protein
MKWIMPLLGAVVLCAIALPITALDQAPASAALLAIAAITAPVLARQLGVIQAPQPGRRTAALLAAGVGLVSLAACDGKPRVEPTQPVPIEPCKPGHPDCTWPDGQPK